MHRAVLALGFILAVALFGGILLWNTPPGTAQQPVATPAVPPLNPLPLSQIVLFNSGVGYFQREGDVEGSTRIDLTFPADAVNDLLKSLVLQDQGDGMISAVSYDNQEPVEKTLRSFAFDLTYNPTLGQLLNQARGQKVEVTMQQSAGTPATPVTGQIVGMETQQQPGKDHPTETDILNLLCAEGLRGVPLAQVLRVRFLDPPMEEDFRRALGVLASARDGLRKTVSLNFAGDGRRRVVVGYVVENPMWKTSYRLSLGKDGKLMLHAWAVVENTSDEDWKAVRMVLVASRPISFEMNLAQPLFVPRPAVEPEHLAALRPPVFSGAMVTGQLGNQQGMNLGINLGGAVNLGGAINLGGGINLGGYPMTNRYQFGQFGNLGGQFSFQGGQFGFQGGSGGQTIGRLTFQELQERRQKQEARERALQMGSVIAALPPSDLNVHDNIADAYQYTLEQSVTLPRQKSALLPIARKEVGGSRLCIYNPAVHPRHPLHGLRLKNTSGLNLMQGPITVYDGGIYAGDARLPDLQAGEERLIAYALDPAVEVKIEEHRTTTELKKVRIDRGVVEMDSHLTRRNGYLISNRSQQNRNLVIERPIQEGWSPAGKVKPFETTRDLYRYEVQAPSGKTAHLLEVIEEQTDRRAVRLEDMSDETVRTLLAHAQPSAKLKEALQKDMALRQRFEEVVRELTSLKSRLKADRDEQERLGKIIDRLPRDSEPSKNAVTKFDVLEKRTEQLEEQIRTAEERGRARIEERLAFLKELTVD